MSSKTSQWYHLPAKSRSSGYSKRRKIRQRQNKSMRSRSSSSHNATWRSVSSNEAKRKTRSSTKARARTMNTSMHVRNLTKAAHPREEYIA